MKLIIEKSTDPRHNLAREEFLFENTKEDILYLWRNEPSVIIGRHQNTAAEINEEAVLKEKIHIVRRLTGGGAVFHDMGNINFSYIFVKGHFEEKKEEGTQLMLSFLKSFNIDCYATGRNDICFKKNGKDIKVSGTAMTQKNNRGIFHGCVLFDCNLSRLSKFLTPSKEKLSSKGISSVKARVANLRENFPCLKSLTADQFFQLWAHYLQTFHTETDSICADENTQINRLIAEKYGNPSWTFGRNPSCEIRNYRRFPIGTVELHINTTKDIITECIFTGDFISQENFETLSTMLIGTSFHRKSIDTLLKSVNLQSFFGTNNYAVVLDFLMGI